MSEVTQLLEAIDRGESKAAEELLPLVYEELRRLANARMAAEPPGQTLQPTALVHEAWLRLVGAPNQDWHSRGHFFMAAALKDMAPTWREQWARSAAMAWGWRA